MFSLFSRGKSPRKSNRRMHPTYKPRVEALEDRNLLSVDLGPIVNHSNGHTYYRLTPSKWTDAEKEAVTLGGHLATIRNTAENQWVLETFREQGQFGLWIGLNDAAARDRRFVWVSGEAVAYTNWASPHEPDNYGGKEDYVHLWVPTPPFSYPPGSWNDYQDDALAIYPSNVYVLQGVVEVNTPDLVATKLEWNTEQSGVNFSYKVADANLTQDTTAALYWARGTTFDTVIDPDHPLYDTKIEHAIGDYGPFYVPNSVLGTPPRDATNLLLAVDPPSPGHPHGLIEESNEDNNVKVLQLADLVPTVENPALHKLIYRGQTLSVPLTITNQGGVATGNVNIEYYLSTSSDPDVDGPGNYQLKTDINQPISIAAHDALVLTPPPKVTIPTFIVKDTWYLKVRIVAAPDNVIIESRLDNNLVVSERLIQCSNTDKMVGHRKDVYESAVAQAKGPHQIDTRSIEDFIKDNEKLSLYVYDDRGNAAIGYGFDLENSGVPRADAGQLIADAGLKNYDGDPLTIGDLIRRGPDGKLDPNGDLDQPGGLALAEKLFNLAYDEGVSVARTVFTNFDTLTFNEQKALVDLAYNLGEGNLKKFVNLIEDVKNRDFACAAFELVDSDRTDQVQPDTVDYGRVTRDLFLLVDGYEFML